MKTEIPEDVKAGLPQSKWGKILAITPVVMTVIATALAGLSSSEMTRAQYDRSLAAQQQSKAGDQWGFFQAKRLRSALQHNTLDILQGTTEVHPVDAAALAKLDSSLSAPTLAALQKGELPAVPAGAVVDPAVQAALDAVASSKPEDEVAKLLAQVKDKTLADALAAAKDRAQAFDTATAPINSAIDKLEKLAAQQGGGSAGRDFTAARLRYAGMRYDAEARLNQAVASLYELQVRKGNMSAEHHHNRSQRFFYGMLVAQAAVIVATFSLAAQKRTFLWSLAAAAGTTAISFAVYVYLFV